MSGKGIAKRECVDRPVGELWLLRLVMWSGSCLSAVLIVRGSTGHMHPAGHLCPRLSPNLAATEPSKMNGCCLPPGPQTYAHPSFLTQNYTGKDSGKGRPQLPKGDHRAAWPSLQTLSPLTAPLLRPHRHPAGTLSPAFLEPPRPSWIVHRVPC